MAGIPDLKVRRLYLFWVNHKIKLIIGIVLLILTALSWWGLAALEPFYRNITIAQLPVTILIGGLQAFVFVALYMILLRGGFGKIGKKQIEGQKVNVHFKDVIGIDDAVQEAWELVELIKDRTKLRKIGGRILKGILLLGPPGCGKTYLAKAVATESGLPFLSLAASEFVEIFVGVGASRVRKLFKKARQLAYAYGGCVIFVDELDAMGKNRTFGQFGNSETNSTQNQLLVEMDGLGKKTEENVIIMGATNAPESILDPALLRPGRFDRKVHLRPPNLEGREKVFRYYLSKIKHDESVDCVRLARNTVYKTPADIESIVKEAALLATKEGKEAVTFKEISEAMERIDLGFKTPLQVGEKEKLKTAYHESGHVISTFLLHPTDDVFKASIIPRRSTLGVVYHQPVEEFFSKRKEDILADIKTALGGYVAEKVVYGKTATTTGVSSDFRKAMQLAHRMVWQLGMNNLGLVGDYAAIPDGQLSEEIKSCLNEDTLRTLKECESEVVELLETDRPILDHLAKELVRCNELEYDEIVAIFKKFGKGNPRKEPIQDGETIAPPDIRGQI